eukprot:14636590-Alexandrium_andersonii.AAC.1
MSASLVGSEMCIRDRLPPFRTPQTRDPGASGLTGGPTAPSDSPTGTSGCLLYTSDAADDM